MREIFWRDVIMRILYMLLAVLAFAAWPLTAQTETEPIQWKTVAETHEEFDFDLPSKTLVIEGYEDRSWYSSYRARHGETTFWAVSGSAINFDELKAIFSFTSEFNPKCDTGPIAYTYAQNCSFEESGFTHSFKIIATSKRYYRFYAYSRGKLEPSVTTFFDSIRYAREIKNEKPVDQIKYGSLWKQFVDGIAGEETAAVKETTVSVTMPAKVNPGPAKTGGGIGSGGSGSGGGIGGGPGKGTGTVVVRKPHPGDKPLQLLAKPRPAYTDIARRFNVTGSVKLQVTFKADGTIGAVTAWETLPFGMTKSAIEAARRITFRPEQRNGVKVGVVKSVVYNFTIY